MDPSAMPPMTFESPIPIENSGQVAMITTSTLSVVIPAMFVGLRLYARTVTNRSLDWSDYCILIALVFNMGVHIDCWIMVLNGGFGFHIGDIAVRFGPQIITNFFKAIMAFCILWNAAICFSKLSVLFLYMTLIPVRKMIVPARVFAVFIVLWNSANIIAQLLICQPFAMNWDQSIPGGKCGSQRDFYFSMGVVNIFTDVVMLALPLPFLLKLQLPTLKKVVLIGMFSIGIMTTAVSIYRQVTLPAMKFDDMTHSGLVPTLFSGLEPPVAISLACIPYLRPLIGSLRGNSRAASKYNLSGADSHVFSASAGRKSRSRTLDELNDGSGSEVQLQPVQAQTTGGGGDPSRQGSQSSGKREITVVTKWEVTSEV